MDAKNYLTVKQVPEQFPAFSESSIRWLILNRHRNGFASVVRKAGRKILIEKSAFIAWIEGDHDKVAA